MRKLVFAQIGESDLETAFSEVPRELQKLCYCDKAFVKNGKYIIQGKKQIKIFVDSMIHVIDECREIFKDEESVAAFDADEKFLKSLLKIKAS